MVIDALGRVFRLQVCKPAVVSAQSDIKHSSHLCAKPFEGREWWHRSEVQVASLLLSNPQSDTQDLAQACRAIYTLAQDGAPHEMASLVQ